MLAWILVIIVYVLGMFPSFMIHGMAGNYLNNRWFTFITTVGWPLMVILGIVSVIVAAIKGD